MREIEFLKLHYKAFLIALALVFSIVLGTFSICGLIVTSDGEKVGYISKVAKEGIIWGTWEAELLRGGLQDASGAPGGTFYFGFGPFKNEMAKTAIYAMEHNQMVTLKYKCKIFVPPWISSGNCIATSVIVHDER